MKTLGCIRTLTRIRLCTALTMFGAGVLGLFNPLPARAATNIWTGGLAVPSGFPHWSVASNWAGLVIPAAGNDLVFPASALQRATLNNVGITNYSSIVFGGGGYSVIGNGFFLARGIRATNSTGTNALVIPIRLAADQTFSNAVNNTRLIFQPFDLNAQDLTLTGAGDFTFSSVFDTNGFGNLIMSGTGELFLSGSNTFRGATIINSGVVLANGFEGNSPVTLAGGTLSGTGTVGRVTATTSAVSKRIVPGDSTNPGILKVAGNLILHSSARVFVRLDGTIPGINYDHLNITGGVALNNAGLNVTLGFTPLFGTAFLILRNDGSDPITNRFAGLAEGAKFTENGIGFQITYQGGDGNDVVLTSTTVVPTGITRRWHGTGANNRWSTPENWSGDVVPQPGDDLAFFGGLEKTNANDLAAGTTFNSLTFSAIGRFSVSGNPLSFLSGIVITGSCSSGSSSDATTFGLDLSLAADARIDGALYHNWEQPVDLNGRTLTISNCLGEFRFHGGFTGSGSVIIETGDVSVSGTNTHSGTVTIRDGALRLNDASTTRAILLDNPSASLEGSGSVGTITATRGRVYPSGDLFIGRIRCNGFTAGTGAVFNVVVSSLSGTHSELEVNGPVTLGNSQLDLGTLVPSAANPGRYTIIHNDGSDAIVGTFAGLPEGSTIESAGLTFRLSYTGGDGNDVVVTHALRRTGVLRTWDGGGAGIGWQNASNWVGDVTPSPGDDLLFPDGTAKRTNSIMDLVVCNSIRLTGRDYRISGSSFTVDHLYLNDGVTADGPAGTNVLDFRMILLTNQTFACVGAGRRLVLSRGVFINANILTLVGSGIFEVPSPGSEISDVLRGAGTLVKEGPGTLILGRQTVFTGSAVFRAGTVLLNGGLPRCPFELQSGLVRATGTVNTIECTGPLTKALHIGSGPGLLNASNALFDAQTTLAMEIDGLTPGTDYSQLNVTGRVHLADCVLNLSINFAPPFNHIFAIIQNDGSDPVNGIFAGLPEGATFTNHFGLFQISYTGGDGNDVVIRRIFQTTGVTRVWDGGGANNFWTTAGNWAGDASPEPGDDLEFPSIVPRRVNTNDYAAGTIFNSIKFNAGWDLHGNSIGILGGMTNRGPSGFVDLRFPITLQADQTFAAGQNINLFEDLTMNGKTLTVAGVGSVTILGDILGDGALRKMDTGSLHLLGVNALTNPTAVLGGTLTVSGNHGLSPVSLVDGSLQGGGIVKAITAASGIISPGIGTLTDILDSGTISLAPEVTFHVDLRGASPGTGYDRLNVTGTVNLAQAVLEVRPAFTPALTDSFVILANDGTEPVTNIFEGLLNGGRFVRSNIVFEIRYDGGDGNDIVLQPILVATGVTRVWDGGGTNSFWTTPQNWVGDVAPEPGDSLEFPAAVPRRVNTNNYFSTTFNSINFIAGWDIAGNSVELFNGITNRGPSGFVDLRFPVRLLQDQTFVAADGNALLSLLADITLNGNALSIAGAGGVFVRGNLKGSGSLIQRGPGGLFLQGTNLMTGPTTVLGGSMSVSGNHSLSPILLSGGTLQGGGIAGPISGTGGIINPASGTLADILDTGTLNFGPGFTLEVDLRTSSAGSGYDRLNVAGNVNLGGATLDLRPRFTPAFSNSFIIVANDASESITGTFAALPEGGQLSRSNMLFQITYHGGDGNDVVLRRVPVPSHITTISLSSGGNVSLQGQGDPGLNYTLEASTNLIHWLILDQQLSNPSGVYNFIDEDAPFFPMRFYRVSSP